MVKVTLFENILTFDSPSGASRRVVTTEDTDKLRDSFAGRWQNREGGGLEMKIDDKEVNDFDLLLSKGEGGFDPNGIPIIVGSKKKET